MSKDTSEAKDKYHTINETENIGGFDPQASDSQRSARHLDMILKDEDDGSRLPVLSISQSGQRQYTLRPQKKNYVLKNGCKEVALFEVLNEALKLPHILHQFENSRLRSVQILLGLLRSYNRGDHEKEQALLELAKIGENLEVNLKNFEVDSDTELRTEEECLKNIFSDFKVTIHYSACEVCGTPEKHRIMELVPVLKRAVSQAKYRDQNQQKYELSAALRSLSSCKRRKCRTSACQGNVLKTYKLQDDMKPFLFPVPLCANFGNEINHQLFKKFSYIPKDLPSIFGISVEAMAITFQTATKKGFHIQAALYDHETKDWYCINDDTTKLWLEDVVFTRRNAAFSMIFYIPLR